MRVITTHTVYSLSYSYWLKNYVTHNTQFRNNAETNFETDSGEFDENCVPWENVGNCKCKTEVF